MLEEIFKNIAYLYYPIGISNISNFEDYNNSVEFNRLLKITTDFPQSNIFKKQYLELVSELKEHEELKNINDNSLFHWQDRSISLEVDYVVGEKLNKLCINISLLIPFYCIYVLENEIELNPYKWKTLPERNKELEANQYKEIIYLVSEIIEKNIKFCRFPEEIANSIIPDIGFKDVQIGEFTYFNAFFLDENKF